MTITQKYAEKLAARALVYHADEDKPTHASMDRESLVNYLQLAYLEGYGDATKAARLVSQ